MKQWLIVTTSLMLIIGIASSQPTFQVFNETNSGLPYNQIYCIDKDLSGNYWFGCLQSPANGLFYVAKLATDMTTWTAYTVDQLKLSDAVRYAAVDKKNNVWFATRAGCSVLRADGTVEELGFTRDKSCRSIQVDSKDNVYISIRESSRANSRVHISSDYGVSWATQWAMADMGYTKLTNSNGRPEIHDLKEDSKGNTWFMTYYGVTFRKSDGTWGSIVDLEGEYTYGLTIDKNDHVWVAVQNDDPPTYTTLWEILPDLTVVKHDTTTIPPLTHVVQDIEADMNGHIWFTTAGGGLVEYLPDGSHKQYTMESTNGAIPENVLYDMEIFGNEIWIALDTKGIMRVTDAISSVKEKPRTVTDFKLLDNFPNPFNPTTHITFELIKSGNITLAIYDLSGKLVRTLGNGLYTSGAHTVVWDGKDLHGNSVASGVYVYSLTADGFTKVKKMTLLK